MPKDGLKIPTSEILIDDFSFRLVDFNNSEIPGFTLTLVLLQSYKCPEGLKKQILIKTLEFIFKT